MCVYRVWCLSVMRTSVVLFYFNWNDYFVFLYSWWSKTTSKMLVLFETSAGYAIFKVFWWFYKQYNNISSPRLCSSTNVNNNTCYFSCFSYWMKTNWKMSAICTATSSRQNQRVKCNYSSLLIFCFHINVTRTINSSVLILI